jgi:hypothetical protein
VRGVTLGLMGGCGDGRQDEIIPFLIEIDIHVTTKMAKVKRLKNNDI